MDRLEGGGRLNREAVLYRCAAVLGRGVGMWRWKGNPGSRCGTRDVEMGNVYKEKIKINNCVVLR